MNEKLRELKQKLLIEYDRHQGNSEMYYNMWQKAVIDIKKTADLIKFLEEPQFEKTIKELFENK
jgi:hypothetical protein